MVTFSGLQSEVTSTATFGLGIQLIGVLGVISAICIIGGALLISSQGLEIFGGIVVLIFSIVSLVVGGGWIVGLVLGVLGGILGLCRK